MDARKVLPVLLLPALLACVACTTNRRFAPRESVTGSSPRGFPAASYALAEGGSRGELRVWSDGAELRRDGGVETAVLQLGFELENLGPDPLVLETDAVRVQDLRGEGIAIGSLAPVRVEGSAEAPAGRTARIELWFEAPGLRPRQIDGFEARWRVRNAGGGTFEQATPFQPWTVPPRHIGDDDWYGGWGWGLGFGWRRWCW
jgi:hypothetical protein